MAQPPVSSAHIPSSRDHQVFGARRCPGSCDFRRVDVPAHLPQPPPFCRQTRLRCVSAEWRRRFGSAWDAKKPVDMNDMTFRPAGAAEANSATGGGGMRTPRRVLPREPVSRFSGTQIELTERHLVPALFETRRLLPACPGSRRCRIAGAAAGKARQALSGRPVPGDRRRRGAAAEAAGRSVLAAPGGQAEAGRRALRAFLRAGGTLRRVWGDLRGQFFQNAFQLGTLYLDVANDSVKSAEAEGGDPALRGGRPHRHCRLRAFREARRGLLGPSHLSQSRPAGARALLSADPCRAGRSGRGGDALQLPRRPDRGRAFPAERGVSGRSGDAPELLDHVGQALAGQAFAPASTPEAGRRAALASCRTYRARRWYGSQAHGKRIVAGVKRANRAIASAGRFDLAGLGAASRGS